MQSGGLVPSEWERRRKFPTQENGRTVFSENYSYSTADL